MTQNRVELDEDEVPNKCCLSGGGKSALKQKSVSIHDNGSP